MVVVAQATGLLELFEFCLGCCSNLFLQPCPTSNDFLIGCYVKLLILEEFAEDFGTFSFCAFCIPQAEYIVA